MFGLRHLIALSMWVILFAGCGGDGRPPLCKITGTINLDGKPLEDADVIIEPVAKGKDVKYQRASSAKTDAEGKFQFTTYELGDGVPAGKYRMAMVKQKRTAPPDLDPEMATKEDLDRVVVENVVPTKYNDMATSGLEIEVTSSGMKPDVIVLSPVQTGLD